MNDTQSIENKFLHSIKIKSILKKISIFLFFYFLCYGALYIKKWPMGGFRLEKLLAVDDSNLVNYNLNPVLFNQSFYYLARGTQFFVFESEDKKYVLKFLRSDRLEGFNKSIFKLKKQKKQKAKRDIFTACNLAFLNIPESTAILGMHLKKTKDLLKVTLRDHLGRKRQIDLNLYAFVVQKNGKNLKTILEKAKKTKNEFYAEMLINSFFDLINNRIKKNISNSDPNFFDNFLVVNGKIKEMDFGDFFFNPALKNHGPAYFHEILKFSTPFRKWFIENWPDMLEVFDSIYSKKVGFSGE